MVIVTETIAQPTAIELIAILPVYVPAASPEGLAVTASVAA
jgi:hypothetical protein